MIYCDSVSRIMGHNVPPHHLSPFCCVSCHEDIDEWGYPYMQLELIMDGKPEVALVCCKVHTRYEEFVSDQGL